MENQPSQEFSVTPEARAVISRMEAYMQYPQYNHAGVPTQAAIDLIQEGMVQSFAHFEHCLRQMDSRVHFTAVPLDFYGDQYDAVYPFEDRTGQSPQYVLYVGVNGDQETALLREQEGITPEENMQRLPDTGVLSLPGHND